MTAITLPARLRLPPLLAWIALMATMAAAVAGCASMLPKLAAPALVVTGVVIGGGNIQQQQIKLTFHATNPNNRPIPIRSIECNLELEGSAFAQGATDSPFTLPPLGEADFDVNVTANLNTVPRVRPGASAGRLAAHHPVRPEGQGTAVTYGPTMLS
jgi:LEA14-like dessication related protein